MTDISTWREAIVDARVALAPLARRWGLDGLLVESLCYDIAEHCMAARKLEDEREAKDGSGDGVGQ